MKFKLNNKYIRWGVTAFLVVAASICFYYLMFHGEKLKAGISLATQVLMPVVFGFITAYLLTPVLNYVEQHFLIPLCDKFNIKESKKRGSVIRAIGILVTVFLFVAIICILISMLLSEIVPSIANIVSNFDSYINNITKWLNNILEDNPEMGNYVIRLINTYSEELEFWINNTLLATTSEVIKQVSLSVINVLALLWDFIIGVVIAIYVLISKEKFTGQAKKIAYAVFERDTANAVIRNFRFTHKTFIGFVSGKILDSIIIGILCFIGTTMLNTPYAVLVSVVIGVTNVIPFFGPFLGAIPCTILIFVVDPMHPLNVLYFVIFILALQQFDGNILGPRILGGSTGITGFWVIFSITVFGGLFGVIGMIIGVPIFAVIYAAIKSLVNASLQKKTMPSEIELYINLGSVDDDGFHEYVPDYKKNKIRSRKNKKKASAAETEDKK
ncbi:MAG: AI-2E family transporter [Lachnospiraceae bacterium]|nr:AI-2E family transporter [Lachnospiraceae bacterium]